MKKTDAICLLKPGVMVRVKETGALIELDDPAIKVSKDRNSVLVISKTSPPLRHTEVELTTEKPCKKKGLVQAFLDRIHRKPKVEEKESA